ncbi:hypothetical protein E2K93_01380 [Thalassotalea sp. HSM 43]|uniref:hypothetical protein n=1 Tax=Thalassotalea sp. HSM 43 TaxID=2552945 RepID=UPI0010807D7B|nr:hypothetical protein [Thalassotalea sp. HSM 43]QBY03099.1 hypothetical protein E2K93_01380 [Thalassotalea sp. HSM 43]
MKNLYTILQNAGLNCSLSEDEGSISVKHFINEKIVVSKNSDNYAIKSGIERHILLVLVLTVLTLIMTGSVYGTAIIAAVAIYSFIQVICKAILMAVIQTAIINDQRSELSKGYRTDSPMKA